MARAPRSRGSTSRWNGISTRLQAAGFDAPTPTTVISAADIEAQAKPNVFDSLKDLPALQGSTGASAQAGTTSNGLIGLSAIGMRALSAPFLEDLPRPDSVPVNTEQLFSSAALPADEQGLYVFVRDGHIEITTSSETLQLGKGETGFAALNGATVRPLLMQLFLEFDRTPKPDSANPLLQSILSETTNRSANVCR